MFNQLLKAFSIKTLRDKILITLGLCIVYRLGSHVPIPFISPSKLSEMFNRFADTQAQGLFNVVDMFSGGAFSQMTIFALGIMPYISASIILQLLTVVWPRLEKMMKEQGEAGRRKINQWTRYGTVVLSLFQGIGIGVWLLNENLSVMGTHRILFILTTALTLSAGTSFVMWLGEKITEHGIGNGISMIIAVGIIAEYPSNFAIGVSNVRMGLITPIAFILVFVALIALTALVIVNQQATRKIPVQHARGRMVGRKMVQGGSTFLPLKLNMAGVIPVIFASSLLTFPQMLFGFLLGGSNSFFADWLSQSSNQNLYNWIESAAGISLPGGFFNLFKVVNLWSIMFATLTAFFCYFYTAITFNPVDLADNLKKSGAFIPGRKPGKQTSEYINHILVRITVVGALILIVVALVPDIFTVGFNIPYQFAQLSGGTGLIIVVGVILETMKQIESQLLMRHYEGFRYRGGSGGGRRARR